MSSESRIYLMFEHHCFRMTDRIFLGKSVSDLKVRVHIPEQLMNKWVKVAGICLSHASRTTVSLYAVHRGRLRLEDGSM